MHIRTIVYAALACAFLMAGGTFAVRKLFWRPAVPEIVVELRTPMGSEMPVALSFFYSEAGSDPFRPGRFAPDRRFSMCNTKGARCIAEPAWYGLRTGRARRQSLQIYKTSLDGDALIGGAVWTGRSYPKQVQLVCDLGISDLRNACAIEDVVI